MITVTKNNWDKISPVEVSNMVEEALETNYEDMLESFEVKEVSGFYAVLEIKFKGGLEVSLYIYPLGVVIESNELDHQLTLRGDSFANRDYFMVTEIDDILWKWVNEVK